VKLLRVALIAFVAGVVFVAGCANPAEPVPCTVELAARYGMVDTLGWVVRAPNDTVGPILAYTCDPRIGINGPPS
jgi:hypothetical protein